MRLAAALALIALLLTFPLSVVAQQAIQVVDDHVAIDFPQAVTFHLEAQSTAVITKAEVRFQVEQRSCARAETSGFPKFTPAQRVATQWRWDLREGGSLPPGAVVRYRWRLEDAAGNAVETPEQTLEVMDTRYTWKTTGRGMVGVYWYWGEQGFADSLLDAAQAALARLEALSGARPARPVKLFVYASSQDLRDALVFPQEWTGGVSFGGFNVVAIGIAPGDLEWGRRAITHELAHVINEQVTFNCFGAIPTWLDEGLATYIEDPSGRPQAAYAGALERGVARGRLFSVRSLASAFPTSTDDAMLAYGQSFSLVQYLFAQYGAQKLGALLERFRAGEAADAALTDVYGFDQAVLDARWRASVGLAPSPGTSLSPKPSPSPFALPTFEPFALTSPTPQAGGAMPVPSPTLTPAARPAGGCNAGLFRPSGNGGLGLLSSLWSLGPLGLAGVALVFRRRRR